MTGPPEALVSPATVEAAAFPPFPRFCAAPFLPLVPLAPTLSPSDILASWSASWVPGDTKSVAREVEVGVRWEEPGGRVVRTGEGVVVESRAK